MKAGTTHTYAVEENGARVMATTLTPGKMTIFPQASIHTMVNQGESFPTVSYCYPGAIRLTTSRMRTRSAGFVALRRGPRHDQPAEQFVPAAAEHGPGSLWKHGHGYQWHGQGDSARGHYGHRGAVGMLQAVQHHAVSPVTTCLIEPALT